MIKLTALALSAFLFVWIMWTMVVFLAPFVDLPHPPSSYP